MKPSSRSSIADVNKKNSPTQNYHTHYCHAQMCHTPIMADAYEEAIGGSLKLKGLGKQNGVVKK